MKKVLLIGKMNEILEDLNRFLSEYFGVQIGTDNVQTLPGLIRMTSPDLIIISLVGLTYAGQQSVFAKIRDSYSQIPVITVGTEEESNRFLKYYETDQFHNITRPVSHSAIYACICRRLDLKDAAVSVQKEENERKTILAVDDNGQMLRAIKVMLEPYYDVQLAPSGVKALASMGKRRPDLIILDYEMPVCDGRQTLEMIRANNDLKDIPVIFLTGVSDRDNISAVLSLRPAAYILKPPSKEKLLDSIRGCLG